jgi:hypothetical protein
MPTSWERILQILGKTGVAIAVIISHFVVALVFLTCIKLVELVMGLYWPGGQEPLFMDVPLHTIVSGSEIGVFITWMVVAFYRAAREF